METNKKEISEEEKYNKICFFIVYVLFFFTIIGLFFLASHIFNYYTSLSDERPMGDCYDRYYNKIVGEKCELKSEKETMNDILTAAGVSIFFLIIIIIQFNLIKECMNKF